jgi:hypothetical protein
MKITTITVRKDTIDLEISCAAIGDLFEVTACVPVVCGDPEATFSPGRIITRCQETYTSGGLSIPRYAGAYDLIICAFAVFYRDQQVEGIRYVTEIDPIVSQYDFPYPKCNLKALNSDTLLTDVDALGIAQTSCGPNQAELMAMHPSDNTIEYMYNGRAYYFKKDVVERLDAALIPFAQRGIPCLMRYINGSFLVGDRADPEIVDIIQHPAYDYSFPAAYIGAFNLRTEQGLDYYCACTEFLVERYAREDRKYGWCLSYEVGNEVTSQYIWSNAGEMTCEQSMLEYTSAMRLAWLLARKHYAQFRIHTSFDQYFNGRHVPEQPKRYYGMKECIDHIAVHCARDGNFPWNIATHPYPENLNYPDFYHDREPSFTFETRRITFKNIEVMPAYLAQEHLLYKGQPRRIIFPEQGFGSRNGEPYTELEGAHGYCLAYLKIRQQPTIDLFLHHSYMDNPWEFGLNLGVRRFGGFDENGKQVPGDPKPIYYVMRDMDTPAEAQRVREAREFIGPLLFDRLLNPPAVIKVVDHSRDGLTIPGQGHNKSRQTGDNQDKETAVTNFDV